MIEFLKDARHLEEAQRQHSKFLVLAFYGQFSAASLRALDELKQVDRHNEGIPIYVVDVEKIKGIHKRFGVKHVPTVLSLEEGKVGKFIDGAQSARFYEIAFSGAAPSPRGPGRDQRPLRVVVYTGPGCPACGLVKAYLRRHGLAFQEVNVAQDQRAAGKLLRRSGQMAIPQIDINGRLVVGFDQAQLSRLLGIQVEGRTQ